MRPQRNLFPRVALLLIAALAALVPNGAWAQGGSIVSYDELKARYLKLRNTDVEVGKIGEWRTIGQDLVRFADDNPRSPYSSKALFDASIVHEKLFQVLGEGAYLDRSIAAARAIVDRFPSDLLADDALLRIGDIYSSHLSDTDNARAFYKEAIARYPQGDATEVARARLTQLQRGAAGGATGPLPRIVNKGAPLVVIDPGHGGEDFGAEGAGGLYEKDIVLDVAFELERLLLQHGVANVKLTRRGDEFVPLAERTAFANDSEAALFVSLHSNASPKQNLSGLQTFYLDVAGDEASKLLAQRENAQGGEGGAIGDLDFILSDLVQNAKLDDSIRFAQTLHRELHRSLAKSPWKVADLGVRKAPFYVLVGAHMPCVLVEILFVDHLTDAKKLSDKAFRRHVAKGLYQGISQFLAASRRKNG